MNVLVYPIGERKCILQAFSINNKSKNNCGPFSFKAFWIVLNAPRGALSPFSEIGKLWAPFEFSSSRLHFLRFWARSPLGQNPAVGSFGQPFICFSHDLYDFAFLRLLLVEGFVFSALPSLSPPLFSLPLSLPPFLPSLPSPLPPCLPASLPCSLPPSHPLSLCCGPLNRHDYDGRLYLQENISSTIKQQCGQQHENYIFHLVLGRYASL